LKKAWTENGLRDLGLLVLLSLVYRVVFLLAMPRVLDTADAIHYIETAAHLANGNFAGYDPKIPVLYPLLGALLNLVISDMEWACRMVSLAASTLVVIPIYLLCRDMHGRDAARVAGVTIAIWPWLADYGCRVGTEATAALCWITGVWMLSRAMRRGGWYCWIAPLCFFALHLCRAEGMFILLGAPFAAMLLSSHEKKQALLRLIPYVLLCAVLLTLNGIYVHSMTGAATANYRVGFIRAEFDFVRFGYTTLKTLSDVFPVMLGPVLLLFMGAGFFVDRKEDRDVRLELFVLVFVLLQWFVSLFVLSPAPRYLMSPLMALAMWSAFGIAWVGRRAGGLRFGEILRILPMCALILIMLLGAVVTVGSEHLGRRPREPREYKDAGGWMKENLESGLIFTRKPQIGFYAGMASTGPALTDSLDEALARAMQADAQYLVVDERYTAQDVPGLRSLLDPDQAPPTLQWLRTFADYPQARVVLYRLRPLDPILRMWLTPSTSEAL
jgi:4-amino-4-deoxy-L-arabinose transferase-like glycosyltransferase